MDPFCLTLATLLTACPPLTDAALPLGTVAVAAAEPAAPAVLAEAALALGVDPAALLAHLSAEPAVTGAYAGAIAAGSFSGTLVEFAAAWALSGPAGHGTAACAAAWTAVGRYYYGYGYAYDPATGSYAAVPACAGAWAATDIWTNVESWSYQALAP